MELKHIAINRLDQFIEQEQANNFKEYFFFGRDRNDCFVLWKGHKDRFDDYFLLQNALDCNLKFTMEIEQEHSFFLHLKISLSGNKLMTTVYSKPRDSYLYLHSTSCHSSSHLPLMVSKRM